MVPDADHDGGVAGHGRGDLARDRGELRAEVLDRAEAAGGFGEGEVAFPRPLGGPLVRGDHVPGEFLYPLFERHP